MVSRLQYGEFEQYFAVEEAKVSVSASWKRLLLANRCVFRFSYDEYVNVVVGPEKKHFTVHKNIIFARSPFFEKACSEKWSRSGPQGGVELVETDPAVFDTYPHYMYTIMVDVGKSDYNLADEDQVDRKSLKLANTYVLADYLQDLRTANLIMSTFIDHHQKPKRIVPSSGTVAYVMNNSTNGSPLRQIIVDFLVHHATSKTMKRISDDLDIPRALLGEILMAKVDLEERNEHETRGYVIRPKYVFEQRRCRYYQHSDANSFCGEDGLNKNRSEGEGEASEEGRNDGHD